MKKFKRILWISLLVIAVGATFIFLWKHSHKKADTYDIVTPKIGTIERKSVITGSVGPRDEVNIKPQVSGIITKLLKEPGQTVQEGEVIAVVKVIPEISSLNSAESQVNNAQLTYDNAKTQFERQKELKRKGVISTEDYENAQLQVSQAKENYESAQEALQIVKDGISKKYAKYSNTQVRATISGMILDIPIKVGNSVIMANTFNDGTTIATIANMKDMIFTGKMDETDVGKVTEGMDMKVTIGALNDRHFNAKLEYIAPKATTESGAVFFEMRAAVSIPDNSFIRSGYSANAEIVLSQAKNVLTIPESCIEYNGDSTFVYVKTNKSPKNPYEKRAVKVGLSDGINIEIKSGITINDKIRGNIQSDNNEKQTEEID